MDFKKKGADFNILSGDSTGGDGGFGVGTINLDNVTPVFVDPEEEDVFIDMGALHARSKVEKRVRFSPNKDEVEDGKLYWLVWVTATRGKDGPHYAGLGACEMLISCGDSRIRQGYKSMPEHVNHMDKSLKNKIVVDNMDNKSKQLLAGFLKEFKPEFWERSSDELKNSLAVG